MHRSRIGPAVPGCANLLFRRGESIPLRANLPLVRRRLKWQPISTSVALQHLYLSSLPFAPYLFTLVSGTALL